MTKPMRHATTKVIRAACCALGLAMAWAMTATAAAAQSQAAGGPATGQWRFGAWTGGFVPRSALIVGADGNDTRLRPGPSFSLDLQYVAATSVSVYASGTMAFSALELGTSIRPGVTGSSDQVLLAGGTAGVQLSPSGTGTWRHLQPTLRLGGGFKWYSFDLTDARSQLRPTADIGVGFRGMGDGPIEVTAEVRYQPSSFDQSRLPIRGIVAQNQRQSDLLFGIGVAVRW